MSGQVGSPWVVLMPDTWRASKGDLIVNMDSLYVSANLLQPAESVRDWTDYSVRCRFKHESAAFAFIFRYSGGENGAHYRFAVNHEEGAGPYHDEAQAKLLRCHFEKSARPEETLATVQDACLAKGPYTLSRRQFHDLRIDVQGNRMAAYIDGQQVLAAEDTTANPPTVGSIGFSASTGCFAPARVTIKDLQVISLLRQPARP
jgi:hypothetical protein